MSLIRKRCIACNQEFVGHHRRAACGPECLKKLKRDYQREYRAHGKKPEEAAIIAPFPIAIDRDRFGDWLSGFSDGEGTFVLRHAIDRTRNKDICYAFFRIQLRDDDCGVLHLIRSYWRCGVISHATNLRSKITNAKPIAGLAVQRTSDLIQTVIPHFERHPLHAKKRNDFAIWKRGVALVATVHDRPLLGRYGEGEGGVFSRWEPEDREQFDRLATELAEQRKYKPLSP